MKSEGKKSNRNHLDEKQVYGPLSILTLTAQQRNNKLIKQKIMNCPSENKFTIIPRSVADDDIAHTVTTSIKYKTSKHKSKSEQRKYNLM